MAKDSTISVSFKLDENGDGTKSLIAKSSELKKIWGAVQCGLPKSR